MGPKFWLWALIISQFVLAHPSLSYAEAPNWLPVIASELFYLAYAVCVCVCVFNFVSVANLET